MADICCVKEIQEEDVDNIHLPIQLELDLPDHEDPTVNNDDGCKTPTSSAHKIPAVKYTLCPPAPRKPGPKRKVTPVNAVNRVPIDLSREMEMFFEDLDRRIKKSRKQ
ncbi:unnamed protein product [Eruca vesicaria subsp. sativa]|uniref:Cyclin-dependent protein kinase inhibitor SMR3 n=1 Tax=Eruca vesicaria subsp. sativa TaxID=29727 RepID=A0ABC8LA54_ERUVS|nr:unnamed protein product [Eruca vesicaria subsp. sativa]